MIRRLGGVALLALVVMLGTACDKGSSEIPSVRAKESTQTGPPAVVSTSTITLDDHQLREITRERVDSGSFRVEKSATGRIAFNEDAATPVFSPYPGRVIQLMAKPGDDITRGRPLFQIDTPDLVQPESDLIGARAALTKAKNQLELAQRTADRQRDLYEAKAVAQKDFEQAQSDLRNAESDLRAAEGALAGARNRLHVFGKSDAEIVKIEEERLIDRITFVRSPIAGTITTRKLGPGQYVKPDNPDPLFTIANLSTMWLLANVYEADIPLIQVGQPIEVRVLAYPDDVFRARIAYIGASADPITHRIAVRAEVANPGRKLKPEMFASFRILTSDQTQAPALPASAIVREGDTPIVWVATGPKQFTRREVQLGLEQEGRVQILAGVQPGEEVVTRGGIFLTNASQTVK